MPQDGVEVLARWREAGSWWAGEAPLEVVQWRDKRGVRREKSRKLPLVLPSEDKPAWHEDLSVEITLRPRKTRDEKVALACGMYQEGALPYITGTQGYAPLHLVSGYSFGHSVMLAKEIPRRLAHTGIGAACLVDRFSLTGAVEFVRECRSCGVKPMVGSSFEMEEGGEVVLIARDKEGYESLSNLVTACHIGEPRLFPICTSRRLEEHSRGLMCLTGGDSGRLDRLLLRGEYESAERWIDFLIGLYGRDNVIVEVERSWLPWGITVEKRLDEVAQRHNLTMVAGGAVTHARPEDFPAQDTALCAETLCMVEEVIGRKPQRDVSQMKVDPRPERAMNAERYLRGIADALQLYSDRPGLLSGTLAVAEKCDEDVLPSRTRLPSTYDNPAQVLREATYAGANLYHKELTKGLRNRLELELERIERLNFSDHFLTIWDACKWASDHNIHYSGRGSMVDSAVSYCLGLSRIDAYRHNLHFDRFLPEDGSKRPDIDIDFEARRREDIRQYMVRKYGADRVATVAAIGAYNTRGIVREVGKVLGLSAQATAFLAKRIHGGVVPDQLENALDKRPELRDSGIDRERLRWLFRLAKMLADVPRNMRAHSSGVVISERPIAETVPVQWAGPCHVDEPGLGLDAPSDENLRIIQWDKRSAKHYFDKFDILCLRGQDVLSGTEDRVRVRDIDFNVDRAPSEDEESLRAMRSGELIGVPQSASPAMRQAHMRIQTENLHDASLVQAGIRPGVGGAVKINELIARRRGLKAFEYEHPDLEKILGLTYGIVVFQEQIDQLLQTFAGYGSGEAEDIRDEIHKRRREDYGQVIKDEVIGRVIQKGYSQSIAEKVFEYVSGFKGYGFAQGHALAFAEISLRSIYCQQNYPAEYFASLLDAQPAGYYGPCTLVNEARMRGVKILPVDINHSVEKHKVEDVVSDIEPRMVLPNAGIRLALTCVHGLSKSTRVRMSENIDCAFVSFHDFVRRVHPDRDELERLILCGAFDSLCPNRRALLWAVPQALEWAKVSDDGLFSGSGTKHVPEPQIDRAIADFSDAEKAIRERVILGLDVDSHLMTYERDRVQSKGGITCGDAKSMKPGRKAIVVGNPIRLRFPPTPSGKRVVFFDLEDETGLLNVTCFDRTYQRDGHAIVTSPYLTLIGVSQWRDGHTAFLAQRAFPYDPEIARLVDLTEPIPVTSADFLVG